MLTDGGGLGSADCVCVESGSTCVLDGDDESGFPCGFSWFSSTILLANSSGERFDDSLMAAHGATAELRNPASAAGPSRGRDRLRGVPNLRSKAIARGCSNAYVVGAGG